MSETYSSGVKGQPPLVHGGSKGARASESLWRRGYGDGVQPPNYHQADNNNSIEHIPLSYLYNNAVDGIIIWIIVVNKKLSTVFY